MLWLTQRERVTLTILGACALVALGVLLWLRQRPSIGIEAGEPPPYAHWDRMIDSARRVDLNRASARELERLPEVGPALATRIVEYRQVHGSFHSPDELRQVPGIGPKTFDALRDYITVGE